MNNYYPNNRIRVSAITTDSGNLRVVASSVYAAFYIGPALVTSITPTSISNPSTGFYYFDYDVVTPGEYITRWRTQGTHISESYNSFLVNSTMFA
jgi:hypothetical protein